jgi:hypothetical protein
MVAVKRSTPLKADPDKTREFHQRGAANSSRKRKAISPASPAQREKVKGAPCVVCGNYEAVDPAHLIDRSLLTEGQDDPRAVISLCRTHHREYDDGLISVLEHLEPRHREELAFAVERFGLISTLNRVTGLRWEPTV